MEFTFRDKRFPIKSAELSATILNPHWQRKYDPKGDPGLFWTLEVCTEGELVLSYEGEAENEPFEARATAQEMHLPIRRWFDVAGQKVEWQRSRDEKSAPPYGVFYLHEHEIIRSSRLRFTERDGISFRFEWEGLCDMKWDEEFDLDVPFSASGWARFSGVTVQGIGSDTDESMRERLALNLEPDDFIQGTITRSEYRHSFFKRDKLAQVVFTPKEAAGQT